MNTSVKVVPLTVHAPDGRGTLMEILRADDEHFTKFGQVYTVRSIAPNTVRAFHRHKKLVDWFFIVHGSAKFVFIEETKNYDKTIANSGFVYDVVVSTEQNPQLIIVPPGVWHGWMNIEPNTKLISIASETYDRNNPDEERCHPWAFMIDNSVTSPTYGQVIRTKIKDCNCRIPFWTIIQK